MKTITVEVGSVECANSYEAGKKAAEAVKKARVEYPDSELETIDLRYNASARTAVAVVRVIERKYCKTCRNKVGGSDTIGHWQCGKRKSVVTGEFVLCEDERRSASMGYPISLGACGWDGANWEPNL